MLIPKIIGWLPIRGSKRVLTYLKPTLCAGEEDKLFETEKAEINRLLSEIEDRAARVGVLIELAQVRFNKH